MTRQTQDSRLRWQPNLGVLLFVAVFLPLTVALGFWQLGREAEKQLLLDDFQARETAPPVPLTALDDGVDQQYRRVIIQGEFRNEFTVLLENRVRQGRPGFEVLTLFEPVGKGGSIWVNRGWIAGFPERTRLPAVPVVSGVTQVFGHLYRPLREPFVAGAETWRPQWPQVMQNLDVSLLEDRLERSFFPYQLRLEQGARGALQTGWEVVNVQPEKHRGYAVQWFAMAFALGVLAVFANSNLAAWLSFKRSQEK